MSERKYYARASQIQTHSYNNLYSSPIVSSYPLCFSPRQQRHSPNSLVTTVGHHLINSKIVGHNQQTLYSGKPLIQLKRSKSLGFQNNLFLKLACKLQTQKQACIKRNQEVLNQYYENTLNKQNSNKANLNINPQQNSTKPLIQSQKSKLIKSRYEHNSVPPQQQKIKFNKMKSIITTTTKIKVKDQMDCVRTSEAQLKITKTSLDMKPMF